jgi:hypothetical protein
MIDVQTLTDLGLPAAISAVLTVLAKAISSSRQRRSKESILDWLKEPSTTEPFKDDDRAMKAMNELQQSLVFERAFGLKTDSALRNQLLAFAEANHDSMKFQEVIDACRHMSKVSLTQLHNPAQLKFLRFTSKISKPVGYIYMVLGYILFIGGMYLPIALESDKYEFLALFLFGLVFGGLVIWFGRIMIKYSRRFKIMESFLRSWADNKCSVSSQSKEN